ncbi:MAG: hypothetical protein QOH37_1206, partial [Nocardioidaceae bacterium]|nr:hypothetical protein [Nocardioidaceae bacterium]
IVRDGNRRLRRRRNALAGGVAGTLAVVAGAAALTLGGHSASRAVQPADNPAKPLSYAVGSVIHSDGTTIDVGTKIESMVSVEDGFVFSGPDRTVYLETNGATHALGHIDGASSRLYASDDGLVAAWWDGEQIQTWPGYRYNGSGEEVVEDSTHSFGVASTWPSGAPPHVEALSDGHLWTWDGQHTVVAEVRPLTSTAGWKDAGFSDPEMIRSAAGARVLIRVGDGMAVVKANLLPPPHQPGWADWEPGTDVSGVGAQVSGVTDGVLSPEGDHWFTQDSDQFAVFDSATGERQDPRYEDLGFAFAAPYQWLGNDTIAALALPKATNDPQLISLLTCHVSTNDCTVTARDIGDKTEVAITVGESLQHQ